MDIIKDLLNISKNKPASIIFEDENDSSISYKEFEIATGKLYNYLLFLDIPKERIVAIRLKRSYRTFIAMMGVIKAAIPYVVIGDTSPKEYVDQVYEECEPILTIDDSFLNKALEYEYLEGFRGREKTDFAYVVYSTGSTGRFKGSMHEYGAIERIYNKSVRGLKKYPEAGVALKEMCYFFLSGFYGGGSLEDLVGVIVYQTKLIIIKSEHANDVDFLIKFANEKRVYTMPCSPMTLPEFVKHPSNCIKEYYTFYEMFPCKYSLDYHIYNGYGLSESCGEICFMEIDKDYDITPIGKPCTPLVVDLLDKNDNEIVKQNEMGELAFIPEYFRGYIKHQDLLDKVLYNGYFHTGDLGYYDDNDNIVIVGRKKDILETKGGYVIPIFISNIIKKEFNDISKCLVKIYKDENPSMIVVYYISELCHDIKEINDKINDKLPSYSLPTHVVKLDKFEYFFSGKLNRNLFKKPAK